MLIWFLRIIIFLLSRIQFYFAKAALFWDAALQDCMALQD